MKTTLADMVGTREENVLPRLRNASSDLASLVIPADDQQVLARGGVPPRRVVVDTAVAHVEAIHNGITKRSAASSRGA
jgi:hypothetical protein